MPTRHLSLTAIAAAAALGCAGAWALGFGPVRTIATIGQPLDASVVVRLQPGETLADNCVSATVTSGDTLLPASQVTATFINVPGAEPRVRVRTSVRIEEPFVNLTVSIGCEAPLARQFTVFADPPPVAVALESTAAPVLPSAAPLAPRSDVRDAEAASVLAGGGVAPPRPTGRRAEGQVQRPARERPAAVVTLNRSRADAVRDEPALAPSSGERSERTARVATGAVTRTEGVARLRLDAAVVAPQLENPVLRASQQREEALQTAKIAVDVAEAANTSAAQKIAAMEQQLEAARKEAEEARAALKRLQVQQAASAAALAAAAAAPPPAEDWLSGYAPWLAAGCGVLLLLSGGLYWRLRRSDAERLQGWMKDNSRFTRLSEFDTVAPVTEQFSELEQTTLSPALNTQAGALMPTPAARGPVNTGRMPPAAAAFASPPEPTRPAPLGGEPSGNTLPPLPPLGGHAATGFGETQPSSTVELDHPSHQPDISIEELLDVEQQAEFFVVLGQDDAAIDLLTNHVMSTGGASPMPYLKLLEIYRRIGDQTSYERTRKRFNARFNGVAPEWGADPNAGRSLLEYPDVLHRIQGVWAQPVDAMAELQTLMFRNDSNLLFDLPAYRDIMLLFTVARDLHESTSHDQPAVDVLLPLSLQASPPAAPPTPATEGFPGLRLVVDDEPPAAANSGRR
jgi:hypothetical protein